MSTLRWDESDTDAHLADAFGEGDGMDGQATWKMTAAQKTILTRMLNGDALWCFVWIHASYEWHSGSHSRAHRATVDSLRERGLIEDGGHMRMGVQYRMYLTDAGRTLAQSLKAQASK